MTSARGPPDEKVKEWQEKYNRLITGGLSPYIASLQISGDDGVAEDVVRYYVDEKYRQSSARRYRTSRPEYIAHWAKELYQEKGDPRRALTLIEIVDGIYEITYHEYRPETILKANEYEVQQYGIPFLVEVPSSEPTAYWNRVPIKGLDEQEIFQLAIERTNIFRTSRGLPLEYTIPTRTLIDWISRRRV